MEVSLTDDKVDDVIRQIPNGEDVYVAMHWKVLKRSEKLNSYGVSDGCTIQVTSRMRGGGSTRTRRAKRRKTSHETRVDERRECRDSRERRGQDDPRVLVKRK